MNWSDIEGYFSSYDADFVANICKQIHGGVVVELGVFAGKSTAVMAPICKQNDTSYHAIDNFCGGGDPPDKATIQQRRRDIRSLFDSNMEKMCVLDYINVHQADSAESASTFEDGSVDFCFIDADHSATAVQKDIDSWWPKIKMGGFLGGHDYPSPPLKAVVTQFVKANQLQLSCHGRCWSIKKGDSV